MRYFLYISDAKLEMLADQLSSVDSPQKSLIVKGGLGTWFGIERHIERAFPQPETREMKLKRVCDAMRSMQTVGSLRDLEKPWVEDTFSCYVSYPVPSQTGAPVVLFHHQEPADCSPTLAKLHILLVGSAAYMMPRATSVAATVQPLDPGGHWREVSAAMARILEGEDINEVFESASEPWTGEFISGATDGPYSKFQGSGPAIRVKSMFRILHKHYLLSASRPRSKVAYLGTPLYVEWC